MTAQVDDPANKESLSPEVDVRPGSKADPYRTYRIAKQIVLILAWVSIGLYAGLIGPTLTNLRDKLGVGTDEISLVLVGKSFGFLCGALIGGFLYRLLYKRIDLLICLSIAGMSSIALVPWGDSLPYMVFFSWTAGTAEGLLNVGGSLMVLHLWGVHAATPLLLTHFGFGVGSFLAPQIARPFLSSSSEDTSNTTSITHLYKEANIDALKKYFIFGIDRQENSDELHKYVIPRTYEQDFIDTYEGDADDILFAYSYLIIGILILCIALCYAYFVVKDAPAGFAKWIPAGSVRQMLSPGSCAYGHKFYSMQLLILLFLFYAHYAGGNASFSDFIFTFATESELQFSDEEAAAINSTFWLCYTMGRLVGALISHYTPVQVMLASALALASSAMVTMALWAEQSATVFWIFTCVYGLTVTIIFPSGFGWSNIYLDMNSMSTMLILMGNGLGKIPYSYLAGYSFENNGPGSVFYVSSFCFGVTIVLYVLLQLVASCQSGHVFANVHEQDDVVEVKTDLEQNNDKIVVNDGSSNNKISISTYM